MKKQYFMKTFLEPSYNIPNIQNARNIYEFKDGSIIQFNRGSFDDYRVTYFPNKQKMNLGHSPKDEDYFLDLIYLKDVVGYEVIWNDFMTLSDMVKDNGLQHNASPDYSGGTIAYVRIQLNSIVKKYPANIQEETFKLFMTLWAVMISEWYHTYGERPSILKHTPKVIGVYQVLNNIYSPKDASEFSKNDKMMDEVLSIECPEFNLSVAKNKKLKAIMGLYQIDYSWLN